MDHRQTNTQSIRHTEMTNKRNKFLSSHSSLIIELQLWSHYHSPIIIIIIYWPDWNRSCSGGRRTSVLKGDLVVVHVEDEGERRESGRQPIEDSITAWLRHRKEMREKEELKEISSTFDIHSRETTATILLARKREANILKMIALQLCCLQRRQKRNGK